MNSRGWRFVLLAIVIGAASCSGKGKDEGKQATDAATVSSDAASAPVATSAVDTKDLGALVDLIAASANNLPRAEFDPAARAASIGSEPQKLFEWVRDHTWWAPYRGLLRGSKGVMLDRVGSNLDRAVLLGDLMRRSGHTVRLAHAQLPETQARELLAKVRPIPDTRRSPIEPKPLTAEQQRAAKEIVPGFEESLQQQAAVAKKRWDEAVALIRSQTDQLYAAVGDKATRSGVDDRTAIAALQDHWWVEYDDDGKWTAMDVLLPDATIGNALATLSATSDWAKGNDAPSIPDADWHVVEIRVVVERYEDGATSEFTVLETALRPAEVLDQPITLSHVPRPWPETIADPKTDPNAAKNASLWVSEWMPFLQVGDIFVAQAAFTDRGELKTRPLDPVGQLGGGGLMGGMDAALGGGADVESFATAEWIDYELRVPGESNQRLRRPIFDILGPSKRAKPAAGFDANADALKLERAEALWSRTDILLQPCDFTQAFVADLGTASIVANQAALKELSLERDPAKVRDLASTILARTANWGPLPDLVLWRSVLGKQPSDWFIDRPNVLNYRVSRPKIEASRVTQPHMIDIASNSIGVRRAAGANAFRARLEQGVSDTVAELLTLGGNLRAADNTASIFAMAPASSQYSVLIGPGRTSGVLELGWAADPAARLEEDIDAGFMAIALREPVVLDGDRRVGWWRVDPATGETIGVMDTGFHMTMAERAAAAAPLIATIQNFIRTHPIPQAPPIGDAARAAWQNTYGGLAVLHHALWGVLAHAARAGFCVPGMGCV